MHPLAYKFIETLDRSEGTKKAYAYALERFHRATGEELTDESYEKFFISIRKLSPSTRKQFKSAVMAFYDFYEIGSLSRRKKFNGHHFGIVHTDPVNFDRDDVEKILSHCESLRGDLINLRDRAFVLCLADSGFRISELALQKRGDIDWREQRAFVVGKGDKPANVRLSKRAITALKDYLAARAEWDGASGKPLNSLPLFAQHGNINKIKAMTVSGMRKAIKIRMKEIGVNVRIHDFRHYFVTMALLASGNLETASKLARHANIRITERYAHYNESELDQQYDEIFNR